MVINNWPSPISDTPLYENRMQWWSQVMNMNSSPSGVTIVTTMVDYYLHVAAAGGLSRKCDPIYVLHMHNAHVQSGTQPALESVILEAKRMNRDIISHDELIQCFSLLLSASDMFHAESVHPLLKHWDYVRGEFGCINNPNSVLNQFLTRRVKKKKSMFTFFPARRKSDWSG